MITGTLEQENESKFCKQDYLRNGLQLLNVSCDAHST